MSNPPEVQVVSFGFGHATPPEADLTIDARRLYRNPHHDPQMWHLTGLDSRVRGHVLATPGVGLVLGFYAQVAEELISACLAPVTVAVGCVGGRHRSVVMADALAVDLRARGVRVELVHRDVDKPVIQRSA